MGLTVNIPLLKSESCCFYNNLKARFSLQALWKFALSVSQPDFPHYVPQSIFPQHTKAKMC